MTVENDKKLLDKEIESLNEEIKNLGYQLSGVLNVDCSFGVCAFDPDADSLQDKMKEIQEKRALLERLKENINSCLNHENR